MIATLFCACIADLENYVTDVANGSWWPFPEGKSRTCEHYATQVSPLWLFSVTAAVLESEGGWAPVKQNIFLVTKSKMTGFNIFQK